MLSKQRQGYGNSKGSRGSTLDNESLGRMVRLTGQWDRDPKADVRRMVDRSEKLHVGL